MSVILREKVGDLLRERGYEDLVELCLTDRRAWKSLRANLYQTDEELVWPAVEATAQLMRRWWRDGYENKVREFVRGLFWSLNDESGGIGWNAPQTIAEIIVQIPEMADPYTTMMMDRALDEPPLVKSGLWALGRLGERAREAAELFWPRIRRVFGGDDIQLLGLACWAVGRAGLVPAGSYVGEIVGRSEPVRIFANGVFTEKPLGEWAEEARRALSPQR